MFILQVLFATLVPSSSLFVHPIKQRKQPSGQQFYRLDHLFTTSSIRFKKHLQPIESIVEITETVVRALKVHKRHEPIDRIRQIPAPQP